MPNPPISTIPFDTEAEQAVIGSILTDNEQFDIVAEILNDNDFYDLRNTDIFKAISKLAEKGEKIDIITVSSLLKRGDRLDKVGGSEYLADCINLVPISSHAEHYANIVKEKSIRRRAIEIASKTISEASGDYGVDDFLDFAQQEMLNLSSPSKSGGKSISETISTSIERIDSIIKGEVTPGIPTGIKNLDNIIYGLQKSDLIIIGARPSVGKTSLAVSIARNIAKLGKSVALFSLEMSAEQINDRILSIDSGVPLSIIRNPAVHGVKTISEKDYGLLKESVERLEELNIIVDDSASLSIVELRRQCRRLHAKNKLSLIIIDYIGLMKSKRDTGDPVKDIAEITRGLKLIAKELRVPVLALSQLNRGLEGREDKTPRLSDLRDSGAIEQDADIVIFISRVASATEQMEKTSSEKEILVTLSVAKHRNGPLGDADVIFLKDTTEFKTCPR